MSLSSCPTDRPQPSALQHEASLHDVLNGEPRPSVERLQLAEQVKRFAISWITSLREHCAWSHQVSWSPGRLGALERRSWRGDWISVGKPFPPPTLPPVSTRPPHPPQFTTQSGRFPVLLRGKSLFLIGSCPSRVTISCKRAALIEGLRFKECGSCQWRGGGGACCLLVRWRVGLAPKRSDVFLFFFFF